METLKPTLHCILAINVQDTSIGVACGKDLERISNFLKKLTTFINLPYKEITLQNDHFTVDGIRNAIEDIKPDKNDIIIFAYSGHGFRFKNESGLFPQLAFFDNEKSTREIIRENTINIEEVFNLVITKGARLNLVFGDCCNNELSFERVDLKFELHNWPIKWDMALCSKLFEKEKGSYLVAAASKGQLSCCTDVAGGFFTFYLIQFIETAFADGIDWKNIIAKTGEFAAIKSINATGKKEDEQNAISRMVS